ncbi:MAG: hypothetical protein H6597_05835 [Flavobacteriales bacterium]|nr:hypothetical protein [Flavobacteriales bacterium]MCB9194036.1 hypothetical protein [Flavobacteriales bacterium]
MTRAVIACLALFMAMHVRAQLFPVHDTTAHGQVFFEGAYLVDANSVYNEMLAGLTGGGFLDRELRQRSSDALRPVNRLGQELVLRMGALIGDSLFHRPGLQAMITVTHQELFGVRFTPDAYDLAFFGNADYGERTADLGGSAYLQQRFQTLGLGLHWSGSGSWLQLEFVKGQQMAGADLEEATLFTAADGRSLDAMVRGTYQFSDTSGSQGLEAFHGAGIALSYQWLWRSDRARWNRGQTFRFRVDDIGVIWWNKRSRLVEKDSTYDYQGIQVDNIFDLGDVAIGSEAVQDTLGLRGEQRSFSTLVGYRVGVGYRVDLQGGWAAAMDLVQRALPGYVPLIALLADKRIGKALQVGLSGQYGGFGGLRLGFHLDLMVGRSFRLQLGTSNLLGPLSPRGRGTSGYLNTAVLF